MPINNASAATFSSSVPTSLEHASHTHTDRTNGCKVDPQSFRIRMAYTKSDKQKAATVRHSVYQQKGLTDSTRIHDQRMAHVEKDIFTLLLENSAANIEGTASVVFDHGSLPCDAIFQKETDHLRTQRQRLCEVTCLALKDPSNVTREKLVALFNLLYLYARRLRSYDVFLAEVNPRHALFYQRMLGFKVLAGPRPCPRVAGAPALLLGLDFATSDALIPKTSEPEKHARENHRSRMLYGYFQLPQSANCIVASMHSGKTSWSISGGFISCCN